MNQNTLAQAVKTKRGKKATENWSKLVVGYHIQGQARSGFKDQVRPGSSPSREQQDKAQSIMGRGRRRKENEATTTMNGRNPDERGRRSRLGRGGGGGGGGGGEARGGDG
jgi:hypothetical protein